MALAIVSDVEISPGRYQSFFTHNGQSHESNEGHGSDEGDEGNEEEGSEQDCQGQVGEVGGVQRQQGEDLHWLEEERPDQKQEWQGCEQEAIYKWQEELRQHQGLDRRCAEGPQGAWCQGLCRSQEGHSSLQEGQGALPVSKQTCAC